jgi:hypothetical protein
MPDGANAGGILRYLTVAGLALLALVLSLEPDVGFSAPPLARLLFWTLQIVTGLLVLQSVLYLLTRRLGASRIPSWALVLLSGVLGAAVLAPVYWLIGEGLMQQWLGYPARPDDDDDGLFRLPFGGPLLAEYIDILVPVTTAWALICLPRLHWLVPPLLNAQARPALGAPGVSAELTVSEKAAGAPAVTPELVEPGARARLPEAGSTSSASESGEQAVAPAPLLPLPAWYDRLPTELGTDVIAVASELQYLRVWTPRGCALILGALADVESEGMSRGLRVHRSWWVASEHIISVRRTATGAVCVMSDGRQVPVSRRRRAEVLARFGDGVQYRVAAPSKAVAHPDLH